MALKKKTIAHDAGFADWLAAAPFAVDFTAVESATSGVVSSSPVRVETHGDAASDVVFGTEDAGFLYAADATQIFAGAGDDTIHAGIETSIVDAGDGYDRVVLTGETGFHDTAGIVSGWAGVEEITGTEVGDEINAALPVADQQGLVIETRSGDDLVIATSGNDTVNGGAGNDTVTGGAGSDVFVFNHTAPATDVITDFTEGQDVVSVRGLGLAYESLSISDTSEGVMIIAGQEHILLAGVHAATLNEGDFRF